MILEANEVHNVVEIEFAVEQVLEEPVAIDAQSKFFTF